MNRDEPRVDGGGEQLPVLRNRYELIRRLGAGGGGSEVYLGHDRDLNRTVAVKLLPGGEPNDPARAERLRREAQAAATIRHPNVVAVHDIGDSARGVFIVMEYVEGQSLRQLLASVGRLGPTQTCRIAAKVCLALDAAHDAGVVHRDISPANIMVGSGNTVKVLDFGIARVSGNPFRTETGLVLGTPAYISPEQVRGNEPDDRSDLYSLGCCLYQMLTGRAPFEGSSTVTVAYQHLQQVAPPPRTLEPAIPPDLQDVVLRALAKDPTDRYPSAAALRTALQRYAPVETIAQSIDAAAPVRESHTANTHAPTQRIEPPLPPNSVGPDEPADRAEERDARMRRGVGLTLILTACIALLAAAVIWLSF